MDQQDQITLKIPTARQKLLPSFPNDTRGDIKIIFKSKVFCLAKAYLRLQSGFFKKICTPTLAFYEIKQNYNQQAFQKILSCFYGASILMDRTQLGLYYPIIRFLQIQSLLTFIRKDVLQYIQNYDLFVVMKIAHTYSDQQLFEVCLEQLQRQSYQQLKYHQFQLLQTQLSLFKLIIKTHNRHRSQGKYGLQFTEIDQILRDYCQGNNMGQDAYRALKFELIDKNSLTASQYKQIFLDQAIKMKNKVSNIVADYPTGQSIIVNGNNTGMMKLDTNNLAQSVISPTANIYVSNPNLLVSQNPSHKNLGYSSIQQQQYQQQNNNQYLQLTLQMQNTFHKKKNQQLRNQNKMLQQSLKNLKELTQQNQQIHQQMQQQLKNLKQQLKKKQLQQLQHKKTIARFQTTIAKMQKQLQKKTQDIDKLVEQFQQLKKRRPVDQQQQNNMFVQSQFLPAHLIGQMMSQNTNNNKNMSKNKQKSQQQPNYQAMDEQQLQQLYLPRIKFDQQPISTPKYNLPKLCQFITDLSTANQGFSKHVLNLIYRRSLTNTNIGKNIDIRQRDNLLILINTIQNQNIGGFVSVPIPKNQVDYIEDHGAFLFTLTKNQKFMIKKSQASQAIFMSDQYLISFANDLMIASDCLKQKSQCSWPSSYQGAKGIKQRGPVWLLGENQFLIKDLEVYQMKQEEMEMVL